MESVAFPLTTKESAAGELAETTREHFDRRTHKGRKIIGDRRLGKNLVRRLAGRSCSNRTGGTWPPEDIAKF